MAIGIIHDLAVGVHPQGADAWSQHSVLANGIGVGAPPDMYNQMGQDWSQPPWRPDALADVAFAPFSNMLRTILRHAGGLRIDHILGLFRMWWVPNGMPAYAGTFVRYDHDALLGILCLEAHLAGAVVIGEDLGTVEPWVQTALAERGILGTSILWFERADGNVLVPEHWRKEALASVTVHDLPPTAGYLRDEHVRIRAELDLLTRPLAVEQAESLSERQQWLELLRQRGMLAWDVDTDSDEGLDQVLIALHKALASAPSRLLGVAIPDLIGDRRAQNQPGTDQEYPNWRVPLSDAHGNGVLLEEVLQSGPLQDAVIASVQPASS
jgi:4-alpha-glucanotransferase